MNLLMKKKMAVMRIALVVIYIGNLAASILHFSHFEHVHDFQSGRVIGHHPHVHGNDSECTEHAPRVAFEQTGIENQYHGHCLFSELLFQSSLTDLFFPVLTADLPITTGSSEWLDVVRNSKHKLTLVAPKQSPPA